MLHQGDSVLLNRHSAEIFDSKESSINREKANTPSGIYIEFKSNSHSIELLLSRQPKGTYRAPLLSIYKNGEPYMVVPYEGLKLENESGEMTQWKIYMPIMHSLTFKGLEVDDDARMVKVKPSKLPVYFAIGDSITHGVGQDGVSSDKTYAGVIASEKSWELYNLAVGGSQISPAVVDDFASIKADYITILWGYNDWNSGVKLSEIENRYKRLLSLLREAQPSAEIYVITPTYTKTEVRRGGDLSVKIKKVEEVQTNLVIELQKAGDKKLHLINGAELSCAEDLKDVVHFNAEGARKFGEKISSILK